MSVVALSSHRRLFGLAALGALVGAALAFTAPPKPLAAGPTCNCNDQGDGAYACNFAQTACVAGEETCLLVCS